MCCFTVFDTEHFVRNFNGFVLWILLFLMTVWQPIYCSANNQISLSSAPHPYHTCTVWYGQPLCWGAGMLSTDALNI